MTVKKYEQLRKSYVRIIEQDRLVIKHLRRMDLLIGGLPFITDEQKRVKRLLLEEAKGIADCEDVKLDELRLSWNVMNELLNDQQIQYYNFKNLKGNHYVQATFDHLGGNHCVGDRDDYISQPYGCRSSAEC